MQQLALEQRRLLGPRAPWHVGDVAWGLRQHEGREDEWTIRLWRDGDRVVAWSWLQGPSKLEFDVRADRRDLLDEILAEPAARTAFAFEDDASCAPRSRATASSSPASELHFLVARSPSRPPAAAAARLPLPHGRAGRPRRAGRDPPRRLGAVARDRVELRERHGRVAVPQLARLRRRGARRPLRRVLPRVAGRRERRRRARAGRRARSSSAAAASAPPSARSRCSASTRRADARRSSTATRTRRARSTSRSASTSTATIVGYVAMNRLAQETSPYLLQHAANPVDWYPWGDEAFARARAEDKPVLLSVGYSACHWCHVMERESFEDDGDGDGDERALRERQGRPGGAPGRRRGLHGRRRRAQRPRRLADDGLPHAGRGAVLRRHVLPARAAARAARVPAGARRDRRGVSRRSASDVAKQAHALVDALGRTRAAAAVERAADRGAPHRGRARAARAVRRALGRLRPRAEVPARIDDSSSCSARGALDMVRGTLDGMARRRHVRPRRRRLPPLLGRRAVARAALREDALRQRAARSGVPARLARDRRGPYRRVVEQTVEYACASCGSTAAASPRRRTPTPTASRG